MGAGEGVCGPRPLLTVPPPPPLSIADFQEVLGEPTVALGKLRELCFSGECLNPEVGVGAVAARRARVEVTVGLTVGLTVVSLPAPPQGFPSMGGCAASAGRWVLLGGASGLASFGFLKCAHGVLELSELTEISDGDLKRRSESAVICGVSTGAVTVGF